MVTLFHHKLLELFDLSKLVKALLKYRNGVVLTCIAKFKHRA